MPSTSGKQHRLMEAAAHDPAVAKKTGVPQSVARDFVLADIGHKFAGRKSPQKPKGPRR